MGESPNAGGMPAFSNAVHDAFRPFGLRHAHMPHDRARHDRGCGAAMVILTANGTRDLSDALLRRCLYAFVEYPDRETELAILTARHPGIERALARQIIGFVQALRREELVKTPGVAETLDFAAALMGLGLADPTADPHVLQATLATLLKDAGGPRPGDDRGGAAPRRAHGVNHTRLVRITAALRDRDALRAMARMSLMADGFGGGSRIGASLDGFARSHARRFVDGRTVVVILSDGYDTEPPGRLAVALARLRRRGCRIVWLNPLKGWTGYASVAAAMAAALPHLHLFAAANRLADLAALESELGRL